MWSDTLRLLPHAAELALVGQVWTCRALATLALRFGSIRFVNGLWQRASQRTPNSTKAFLSSTASSGRAFSAFGCFTQPLLVHASKQASSLSET